MPRRTQARRQPDRRVYCRHCGAERPLNAYCVCPAAQKDAEADAAYVRESLGKPSVPLDRRVGDHAT